MEGSFYSFDMSMESVSQFRWLVSSLSFTCRVPLLEYTLRVAEVSLSGSGSTNLLRNSLVPGLPNIHLGPWAVWAMFFPSFVGSLCIMLLGISRLMEVVWLVLGQDPIPAEQFPNK